MTVGCLVLSGTSISMLCLPQCSDSCRRGTERLVQKPEERKGLEETGFSPVCDFLPLWIISLICMLLYRSSLLLNWSRWYFFCQYFIIFATIVECFPPGMRCQLQSWLTPAVITAPDSHTAGASNTLSRRRGKHIHEAHPSLKTFKRKIVPEEGETFSSVV